MDRSCWDLNSTNFTFENCKSPFSTNLEKFSKHIHNGSLTLGIFSIFPNLIVIISSGLILKSKVQPRSTHMFLGNLALADFVYGIITLLMIQIQPTIQQDYVCAILIGFAGCYYIECSFSVCFIAVDRYLFIHYGLHYSKWITTKRARYMVLATWTFSLFISVIMELIFANYTSTSKKCHYFSMTPKFVIAIASIIGILPYLITIAMYFLILITAIKASKIHKMSDQNERKRTENSIAGKIVLESCNLQKKVSVSKDNTNNILYLDSVLKQETKHAEEPSTNDNLFSLNNLPNIELNIIHLGLNLYGEEVSRKGEILRNLKRANTSSVNSKSKARDKNKSKCFLFIKSFMVLLLLTSSFMVAWGPCFICLVIYLVLCSGETITEICFNLETALLFQANYLGLINALINPIIYFWFYKGFRKALLRLFCKNKMRRKRRDDFVLSLKKMAN